MRIYRPLTLHLRHFVGRSLFWETLTMDACRLLGRSIFRLSMLIALATGCGPSGEQRLDFSGTATFDGDPIVYGSASLIPNTDAGHNGPTGLLWIENGKFNTRDAGSQGVLPGKHILRITAYPSRPPESEDETTATDNPDPLFLNYEMPVELTESTFNIEVPAEARGFKPTVAGQPQRGRNDP